MSKERVRWLLLIWVASFTIACAPVQLGKEGGLFKPAPFGAGFEAPKPSLKVNLKTQLNMADQYYRNGELSLAEKAYLEALGLDDSQPIIYYRLGNISFRKKQYQQASHYFMKSLELSPRNAKAHYNLAVTFLSLSEQYFKYYSATLPPDANTSRVTRLLGHIDEFASQKEKDKVSKNSKLSGFNQSKRQNKVDDGLSEDKDLLESLAEELIN